MLTPQQAALDFRNELLTQNWPCAAYVTKNASARTSEDAEQVAARLRDRGMVLGVWVANEEAFRYPDFQFDVHNNIRPDVSALLKVLPAEDEDTSGWRRAFWLYSPHSLLDGRTPAEVFPNAPQSVLEAARLEFEENRDAGW